jgi:hypothetical protein
MAGKILSESFPFRPFFHIFRDVTNYPDLKQSRFGVRINGKIGRREIPIVDSQKKLPDYQSIQIQSQPDSPLTWLVNQIDYLNRKMEQPRGLEDTWQWDTGIVVFNRKLIALWSIYLSD